MKKAVKKALPKKETKARASVKPVVKKSPVVKKAPVVSPAPADTKKKVVRLSDSALGEIKDVLIAMRQRLAGQVEALKGDSLQRQDEVNVEEDGTDAFDRQFALNLASSENDEIYEIDEALRRIGEKNYGLCEQCGNAIEVARLKALPFVKMCIKCKSENEKSGQKFKPMPALDRPV